MFAILLDLSTEKVLGSAKRTQSLSASVSPFPIPSGHGFKTTVLKDSDDESETPLQGNKKQDRRALAQSQSQLSCTEPKLQKSPTGAATVLEAAVWDWAQLSVEQHQCQRQLCRIKPAKQSGLRWRCGTMWWLSFQGVCLSYSFIVFLLGWGKTLSSGSSPWHIAFVSQIPRVPDAGTELYCLYVETTAGTVFRKCWSFFHSDKCPFL